MPQEQLDERQALEATQWLERFLGPAWIEDGIRVRRERARRYGRWSPPRVHDNILIDLLAEFRRGVEGPGMVQALFTPTGLRIAGIATNVRHVAVALEAPKVARLRALLRRGATVDGYLYQCGVAAHNVREGYEIRSFSLGEVATTEDVVVGRERQEIGFQCKAIRVGTGRRIPNEVFNDLAMRVVNTLDERLWKGVVRVLCEPSMPQRDVQMLAAALITRALAVEPPAALLGGYTVEVEQRNANVSWAEVDSALREDPEHPLRRPHVAVVGNRAEEGVRLLLVATSRRYDKVVGKMLALANSAARQLDPSRPGIIAIHTPEPINWDAVANAGALDRQVTAGFRHFGRTPVAALAFTSEGEEGNAYVYRNPDTVAPVPKGLRVFGRVLG